MAHGQAGKGAQGACSAQTHQFADPACKVLTGLAVDHAKQEKPDLYESIPCFLYIPHRSAEDCLLRAFKHCREVRQLLKQPTAGRGKGPSKLYGGVQLCIDLSKAFDQVPRALVKASIRAAGFTEATEVSMLVWMHGGHFEIPHKGLQVDVTCSKGIKQGSRGGPSEWNLLTRYLLWKLSHVKSMSWVAHHVTNYADDFHLFWAGRSEQELQRAVLEAAEILHMLASHQFQLNLAKSAVMLSVRGTRQHAFCRNFVVRRKEGVYLKCKTGEGVEFKVPIVKRWGYLGATISYANFEKDTIDRRLQAAEHAFHRLKPVLGCRRGVPLSLRVQVYQTCVRTTLQYAIFAAGFGPMEARRLHSTTMRHLRYIALSPRVVTRESNQDLCERLGIMVPLADLHSTWMRKCQAWQERRDSLSLQDLGRQTPCFPDVQDPRSP